MVPVDHHIAAIILLSDTAHPNYVRSAQSRQIPLYPVGTDALYSPSPWLLTDLGRVMVAVSHAAAR